ncbi:response regulator transcription factor [Bradyrhizobium sp. U87765 SZCCT0131]|uniref:response regulator transcription factor n=1 Tax=unclassified Bradyrhizobium TaxID=2631580 RepID=UPI001BA4D925|nr:MULTISPECIES: response regulator transcription factor [unclassified Bradyrhizobium]MBR1218907.1 response regulator transcription factor [Bradyrhizobium sp. U87765 SZCCT0131]MBR1261558.1 response regulator transcription factor [Bradyrhizobium sp. U87765 SZCCT0134]MBR1306589.1 response regulator transcription factor [Bradyrhizobium sp. U87765 SZCCT0110]MBR1317340.1 response regulator transcription factor [Bradyrhizobium sp. U87765 SZCCT0109]MBR1351042.1 response regulator transcription factor
MRLLLVEDENEMAAALSEALLKFDVVVDRVFSLDLAREAVADPVHDAIILDRQLPDGDGLSLLPHLRASQSGVPVIVLTARGDVNDRVMGLDAGADDYLSKPFALEELLARLRAVLRRPPAMAPAVARVGQLVFNFGNREVSVGGQPIELRRRELLVLETLMRRHGRTVLRSALEEAVYSFDDEIQSNALDSHISRLRRKLDTHQAAVEIHNIRGVGYLLKAVE